MARLMMSAAPPLQWGVDGLALGVGAFGRDLLLNAGSPAAAAERGQDVAVDAGFLLGALHVVADAG